MNPSTKKDIIVLLSLAVIVIIGGNWIFDNFFLV